MSDKERLKNYLFLKGAGIFLTEETSKIWDKETRHKTIDYCFAQLRDVYTKASMRRPLLDADLMAKLTVDIVREVAESMKEKDE